VTERPEKSDAMEKAPNEKKDYRTPQVRDYGTLRELTHFSETTGPNLDYAISDYATNGY